MKEAAMEKRQRKEMAMKMGSVLPPSLEPEEEQASHAELKPPGRFATKEEFEAAQRETTAVLAGLFRRLAE
jgi:hypothetical protein